MGHYNREQQQQQKQKQSEPLIAVLEEVLRIQA